MNRLVVFLSFFLLLVSCGKKGCMEPLADNYNPSAKKEDGSCQFTYTNIPDLAFENLLLEMGYDDFIDGRVLTARIRNVTELDLKYTMVYDLTGLEDFTGLTYLNCWSRPLTNLDLSQNTALTELRCERTNLNSLDLSNNTALETLICYQNQLTSLDVSGCTALETLHCADNQLTNLDLSNITALTFLDCYYNQITSLDLTNNTALTQLWCGRNQLTSLDLTNSTALTHFACANGQLTCLNIKNSNNQNITVFNATNNPNLNCIEVDDPAWSTANWTDIGAGTTFSTNCNYPSGCF
jgi:hypothetical protein